MTRRWWHAMQELGLRLVPRTVRRAWYGGVLFHCPVCGESVRHFWTYGRPGRPRVRCPVCGSLERHRFLWHWLRPLLESSRRILHFAPERCIEEAIRRTSPHAYTTADLRRGRADLCVDIRSTGLASGAYDLIICSHVLEHVDNDAAAMRELARLLSSEGECYVLVPVSPGATDEDPTITEPSMRELRFGQRDHVRRYGADIVERLGAAGFHVERHSAAERLSREELSRQAICESEVLFLCRRRDHRAFNA